jgi:ElaB/YqjD/DUF883 family membrane-anchored ribosome-binding protein
MNDFNTSGSQTSAADGLAASMHTLADHAEALLHSTATISSDSTSALRGKLSGSLHDAREQLSAAQDYAIARGKRAAQATDSYVHENPWQVIAAATLVGLAIGFLSRGRRG